MGDAAQWVRGLVGRRADAASAGRPGNVAAHPAPAQPPADASHDERATEAFGWRATWRLAPALAAGVAVLGILALYWPTAASIVAIWIRSETFTHGFVVVPICLWLAWRHREALAAIPARPWWPGLALVFAAGPSAGHPRRDVTRHLCHTQQQCIPVRQTDSVMMVVRVTHLPYHLTVPINLQYNPSLRGSGAEEAVVGAVDAAGVDEGATPSVDAAVMARDLPVERHVPPEEFEELKTHAKSMGFRHVESGPLVRSSYHAHAQLE